MCATSVIFEKLPKVSNHPKVAKSPNLVSLILALFSRDPTYVHTFAERKESCACPFTYNTVRKSLTTRVARWFIFIPKSQLKMLVYFLTIWNILRPFGILYGNLVQFVVIWYMFQCWYVWTKKNLATLLTRYRWTGLEIAYLGPQNMSHEKNSYLGSIYYKLISSEIWVGHCTQVPETEFFVNILFIHF
jgi:hypothetical protein